MRILIPIGLLIIFISAFFILLTGDVMARNAFSCSSEGGRTVCSFTGLPPDIALGSFIIGFFLLIDAITVYLIISSLRTPGPGA